MEAYERLMGMPDQLPSGMEQVEGAVAEIQALLASSAPLGLTAQLALRGPAASEATWFHKPLRRKLAFSELEGEVHRLEIRCDWHRYRDAFSTEKIWQIPDSWGDCSVVVFGEPGASFKLLQYPEGAAKATSSGTSDATL